MRDEERGDSEGGLIRGMVSSGGDNGGVREAARDQGVTDDI